jgi:hypothetical protein
VTSVYMMLSGANAFNQPVTQGAKCLACSNQGLIPAGYLHSCTWACPVGDWDTSKMTNMWAIKE